MDHMLPRNQISFPSPSLTRPTRTNIRRIRQKERETQRKRGGGGGGGGGPMPTTTDPPIGATTTTTNSSAHHRLQRSPAHPFPFAQFFAPTQHRRTEAAKDEQVWRPKKGEGFVAEAIEMEVPTPPEVLNRPTAALPQSEFLTRQEVLKRAQATGQGVRRPLLVHDGECQIEVQGVLLGVRLPGEVSILHAHISSTVKNRG
ncbi:uncharacterized protein LOC131328935 isoform X2 [Rhododendron vialii]|nr:uncharacterized protein LOC131328935 isoform X2 [Rhododendron vialii]